MSQTDAFLCAGLFWAITVMILAAVVYRIRIKPMNERRRKE